MPVMQNCNGWLVLHDRDILDIIINIASIQEVAKHYLEERGRSYLCYGDNCSFCHDGIPIRLRYIAQITFHGETLKWEVSAELYKILRRLPSNEGLAKATVSRSGRGKETRYQIRSGSEKRSLWNKYLSGKYGHMVKR
jgi:hypothetical protein